ncbi:MAG: sodium:proton antiporter [Caldilineales bacterium]|nr:sodium:proton antiporter [Caldilineales bacterium]
MSENVIVGIAAIVLIGIGAQWLAWRIKIPSILLLLFFGFLVGPILGLLNPDELFGDLIFPIVSLSVGIILFEGGLGLRLRELPTIGAIVRNLISIGALVTWIVAAAAAYFILGMDIYLSVLLGAILIVSGPTVILPLLRDIRPEGSVSSVLRWEGILIDPVGATMALLVFDMILETNFRSATSHALIALLQIIIIGAALGWLAARALSWLLRRYLIPDHLQNAVTLMTVVAVFALSNLLAEESGLLATTVMGVVLANQHTAPLKRIIEFKEDLGVLIVSALFILLSARLQLGDILGLGWKGLVFLAILIVIGRPLAVAVSSWGSSLKRKEKAFLAWMAPRGIVAASVASLFSIQLMERGYAEASMLVPVTFLVIIGTVVIYGLSASPVALRLGLAQSNPQGTMIVGAHRAARSIAKFLVAHGFDVLLVDTNNRLVRLAEAEGLRAYQSNILYEETVEEMDLGGLGRVLSITSNDEVNALASLHLREVFGQPNVYQLPLAHSENGLETVPDYLLGRILFDGTVGYRTLTDRIENGWTLKEWPISGRRAMQDWAEQANKKAIPLFFITAEKTLLVFAADSPPEPQPGYTLVALTSPALDHPDPTSPDETLIPV